MDAVLMVVDPSHDAVLLSEKIARLAREVKKGFGIVLNKVDEKTEYVLKEMLSAKGIAIKGFLPYSPAIARWPEDAAHEPSARWRWPSGWAGNVYGLLKRLLSLGR